MPDNLSIVGAYLGRIAHGDIEGALRLASDDAVFQGPDGSRTDKAGLRAMFARLKPLMPNPLEIEIVGTTSEGPRIAVEARAQTLLANGALYANIYHFLYELRDERIVAVREYCDTTRGAAFAKP
jgi:ketosteroid isomerase-like protein